MSHYVTSDYDGTPMVCECVRGIDHTEAEVDMPLDTSGAVVVIGSLGWSNMRTGCEFYSEQNDENGRWAQRRVPDPEDKWGDLLVDELAEMGVSEGWRLIVVALPRSGSIGRDSLAKQIRSLFGGGS